MRANGLGKTYGHMNRWKLVDFVHAIPEWKHPEGSAFPIAHGYILKAQNKKPEEIRAIENELQALARIDQFLVAH